MTCIDFANAAEFDEVAFRRGRRWACDAGPFQLLLVSGHAGYGKGMTSDASASPRSRIPHVD